MLFRIFWSISNSFAVFLFFFLKLLCLQNLYGYVLFFYCFTSHFIYPAIQLSWYLYIFTFTFIHCKAVKALLSIFSRFLPFFLFRLSLICFPSHLLLPFSNSPMLLRLFALFLQLPDHTAKIQNTAHPTTFFPTASTKLIHIIFSSCSVVFLRLSWQSREPPWTFIYHSLVKADYVVRWSEREHCQQNEPTINSIN